MLTPHPLPAYSTPGALGTPSWESEVPWSLAHCQPSLCPKGRGAMGASGVLCGEWGGVGSWPGPCCYFDTGL